MSKTIIAKIHLEQDSGKNIVRTGTILTADVTVGILKIGRVAALEMQDDTLEADDLPGIRDSVDKAGHDGPFCVEVKEAIRAFFEDGDEVGDIDAEDWRRDLSVGDEVFWEDPDEKISSGIYHVTQINDDKGVVCHEDTVLLLTNAAGSVVEVFAFELVANNPETLKVRALIDVEVDLNGEERDAFLEGFSNRIRTSIGNGLLTGDTLAEVEDYSMEVSEIAQTPLPQVLVAEQCGAKQEVTGTQGEINPAFVLAIDDGDDGVSPEFQPDPATDLEMKFGYEHPDWPLNEWRQDVAAGDTKLGYWSWAVHQLDSGATSCEVDDACQEGDSDKRDIFREALRANFLSTSFSVREAIHIRRDLIAQEVLGRYPSETVISRELYDSDADFAESLIWMHRHFEFPAWEGRTVSEFQRKHCIAGEPVCMKAVQYSTPLPNKEGVCADDISVQQLWDATPLGESGWLLPDGMKVWFHLK